MTDFISPTGTEIQGTDEMIPGASRVIWAGDAIDPQAFEHEGSSKMFWDGSTTQMIDGAALLTDEDGCVWLVHHLIHETADPLSRETCEAMCREIRIGRCLEDAISLQASLDRLRAKDDGIDCNPLSDAREELARELGAARARAQGLKERDLARQRVAQEAP